jgi:hypothetical protein
MANDVTSFPSSPPLGVLGYKVAAITNINGTTANSLVFTGVPQNYNFNGLLLQVVTHTTGTPEAGYASYNADTAVYDATAGTLTIDVYVYVIGGTAAQLIAWLY